MYISVVNAALADIDDEIQGAVARKGAIVEQLRSVMNEKRPTKKEPRAPAPEKARAEKETVKNNPAFDTWLENKLHTMFDAVASEPLPPDLVKLLEQLDQKTRDDKKDDKP